MTRLAACQAAARNSRAMCVVCSDESAASKHNNHRGYAAGATA